MGDHDAVEPVVTMAPIPVITIAWRMQLTDPREAAEAYEGLAMGINYGLDRVRFPSPVKVGSRVRAHRKLLSAELKRPNTIQLKSEVTVEIDGEDKPACVAETLSRLVYQNT